MSALPEYICKRHANATDSCNVSTEDCSHAAGNQATIEISINYQVLKASQPSAIWAPGCPSALELTRKEKTEKRSKLPSILPSVALLWYCSPDQTRAPKTIAALLLPGGLYKLGQLQDI